MYCRVGPRIQNLAPLRLYRTRLRRDVCSGQRCRINENPTRTYRRRSGRAIPGQSVPRQDAAAQPSCGKHATQPCNHHPHRHVSAALELARERHRSSGTDMSSTGLGMQQRARRTARHAGVVERRAAIEVDRGDLPRTRTQPWTERLVPGQGFPRATFVCSSGLPDLICYRTDSAFADARGRAGRVPWRLDTEPRRLPIGRKATFLGRRLNQQRSAWFPCLTTVGCDSCRSPWESVWPVDIRPASSAFSRFES